jgi:ribonuclease HII
LFRRGAQFVAGVDEVGVGPLAGPVVAAAVILPRRVDLPGLNDSKQVSASERERLATAIRCQALACSVALASVEEIDRLNIYWAALLAMRRAVTGLATTPDQVLVDARRIPDLEMPQRALVHGDGRDGSIAAASILAKVYRDALMSRLDAEYPGYGFANHMGYATPVHRAAIARRGPSPVHRRSFAPCAAPSRLSRDADR